MSNDERKLSNVELITLRLRVAGASHGYLSRNSSSHMLRARNGNAIVTSTCLYRTVLLERTTTTVSTGARDGGRPASLGLLLAAPRNAGDSHPASGVKARRGEVGIYCTVVDNRQNSMHCTTRQVTPHRARGPRGSCHQSQAQFLDSWSGFDEAKSWGTVPQSRGKRGTASRLPVDEQ